LWLKTRRANACWRFRGVDETTSSKDAITS
jgi:hypothetical protein